MKHLIAKRYAKALFELAEDGRQTEKVHADMQLIHQACVDAEDLQDFLKNEVLPAETQEKVLENIFASKIEAVTWVFLKLLIHKGRLEYLDVIAEEFLELVQKSMGAVQAEMIAAENISATQKKDIEARLKKRLHKDVDVNVTVDPQMLGGFTIKIEDQVFDYSLEHQLQSFKEKVLKG